MTKKRKITVTTSMQLYLDQQLWLRKIAQKKGVSVSRYMRDILTKMKACK